MTDRTHPVNLAQAAARRRKAAAFDTLAPAVLDACETVDLKLPAEAWTALSEGLAS